jgi:hypothetical protein
MNDFERWDAAEWDLYLGRKVEPVQQVAEDPEVEALQVYIRDLDEQILTGVVRPTARTGSFSDTCVADKDTRIPVEVPLVRSEGLGAQIQPQGPPRISEPQKPQIRYCACNCGQVLDDRPNKKYVNSRHRWRDSKRRKRV